MLLRVYLNWSFALLAFGLVRCLLGKSLGFLPGLEEALKAVRLLEELVDLLNAL